MAKSMDKSDPLSKLAFKHLTDKCPQIKHSYTPYYYNLLKDRRNSIKKVLEIGVGYQEMSNKRPHKTGASLFMWRDFFSNAQIYGIDISPLAIVNEERITTFLYDQSKKDDLLELMNKIGSDIDLLIDDGSHKKEDQIFTCLTLMPILKKDVIYIIEDARFVTTVSNALSQYECIIPDLNGKFMNDKLIIVKNRK